MNSKKYLILTDNQIDKLGNALIYLIQNCSEISKTKLLKLVYILDEASIKKSGIPFFNLDYKTWQYGPVSEELYIELSDSPTLLKSYIDTNVQGEIIPCQDFTDDEFSDNDIILLENIVDIFGKMSATELIKYTHRPNTPWYKTAEKNGVLELLENGEITNTEFIVDMAELVSHDPRKKSIYADFAEENICF